MGFFDSISQALGTDGGNSGLLPSVSNALGTDGSKNGLLNDPASLAIGAAATAYATGGTSLVADAGSITAAGASTAAPDVASYYAMDAATTAADTASLGWPAASGSLVIDPGTFAPNLGVLTQAGTSATATAGTDWANTLFSGAVEVGKAVAPGLLGLTLGRQNLAALNDNLGNIQAQRNAAQALTTSAQRVTPSGAASAGGMPVLLLLGGGLALLLLLKKHKAI
jgi:hypothetical protein